MNDDTYFARMDFGFFEQSAEDTTTAIRVLNTDEAGDLRTVLDAFAEFLRVSGFSYVTAVAVETDSGNIIFGDEA